MKTDKNLHCDHIEDFHIRHGEKGFNHAFETLLNTHSFLKGNKPHDYSISTKWDGNFSCVFGHDPENGKFFVATKSAFNKTPKLNYSHEDIEKNHVHAPSLVKKLKNVYNHLEKASPKSGVYQGDVLYSSPEELNDNGTHYSFNPNTITYHVNKFTPEGKRISNSKMGIAVHTQYKPEYGSGGIGDMTARYNVDQSKFNHGDVNFIDPKISVKKTLPAKQDAEFSKSILAAKTIHNNLKNTKGYDALIGHESLLMSYLHHSVKNKKEPDFARYVTYIKSREKNLISKTEKDTAKEKIKGNTNLLLLHANENKHTLSDVFQIHKHLQSAKHVIVNALASESNYKHTILDNPSKPEGYVVVHKGIPAKLVDRHEFSSSNFEWNEKVNPEDKPTVFSFGRMNPPTQGHVKLRDKVVDIARRTGADHKMVLTGSEDKNKNPLSREQKLKYAKHAMPDTNIEIAGDDEKSLIDQFKKLHKNGVKHLTVVAGEDRLGDFSRILNKYNGKEFYFKKIRVVNAGQRDPDSDKVEGISATKMRQAAKNNDFDTFKLGLPKHFSDKHAKEMFNDIRKGMGVTQ